MQDRLLLLIPSVFLLVGAFLLFLGLRSRRLAKASQQWPSASGKVTSSYVDASENRDSEGRVSRTFTAKVEYEYAVGSSHYQGNRVRFGLGGSQNQRFIQDLVNLYPTGAVVDVFYDPEKPTCCTLDRTTGSGTFLVILGAIFIVVSFLVGGLVWAIRK